jgi:hypothetical protein
MRRFPYTICNYNVGISYIPNFFLFTTSSRPVLAPTQPPVQCSPGARSPGLKRPGREADHLPTISVEVKNM